MTNTYYAMILSFYPNTFYYSSKFLVILVIYDEREPVVSMQSRVTSDERDLASEVITMTVELLTFLVSPQQSSPQPLIGSLSQ